MTKQQILTKAIQKAIDSGWEFDNLDKWNVTAFHNEDTVMNNWYQYVFTLRDNTVVIDAERIIYDHDFAKALWGEEDLMLITEDRSWKQPWQHHLQQMVIAENPIAYLGANI